MSRKSCSRPLKSPFTAAAPRPTILCSTAATKKLAPLSAGGKQSYATFSPDGKRVAFARDNNLFVVDLATMQETAVTTDGVVNKIINGSADWVYEEEFCLCPRLLLVAG